MGYIKNSYKELVEKVKEDVAWPQYVSEVQTWAHAKRMELGL